MGLHLGLKSLLTFIMKTSKFCIALGIICIATYPPPTGGQTPGPEPSGEPYYGESENGDCHDSHESYEWCRWKNSYAYANQTVECFFRFGRKTGGICVNMQVVDNTKLKKIVNMRKRAVNPPCNVEGVEQPNECVRCFKNKCKQSRTCLDKGGICRFNSGTDGQIGVLGCKKEAGCLCYNTTLYGGYY